MYIIKYMMSIYRLEYRYDQNIHNSREKIYPTTNLSTTPNNRSMVAQLLHVKAEVASKYFTESSTIQHQYGSFM